MCTQKMRALSYIGAEKITFPPKPDIQTYIHTAYIHTYRRTDISVYRVASLLKIIITQYHTLLDIYKVFYNQLNNYLDISEKLMYKSSFGEKKIESF